VKIAEGLSVATDKAEMMKF